MTDKEKSEIMLSIGCLADIRDKVDEVPKEETERQIKDIEDRLEKLLPKGYATIELDGKNNDGYNFG